MGWQRERPDWTPPNLKSLRRATWVGAFGSFAPKQPAIITEGPLGQSASLKPLSSGCVGKAIQIGCGPWDRGTMVPMLRQDHYEIVFLHPSQQGVDLINRTPSYTVTEVRTLPLSPTKVETVATTQIDHYRALNLVTQGSRIVREIATASIVTCFMDIQLWEFISPYLAEALVLRNRRPPLLIIVYHDQNLSLTATGDRFRPESLISTYLDQVHDLTAKAQFTTAVIDRMVSKVRSDKELNVEVETHLECWIPTHHLRHPFPTLIRPVLDGSEQPVSRLEYAWAEKWGLLWTAHLVAAHCTYYVGRRYIHEAMLLPEVDHTIRSVLSDIIEDFQRTLGSLETIGSSVSLRHRLEQSVERIILRLKNPRLKSTPGDITSNSIHPNLVPTGLLCPLFRQICSGGNVRGLYKAIKLALYYQDKSCGRLAFWMRTGSPRQIRTAICLRLYEPKAMSAGQRSNESVPQQQIRLQQDTRLVPLHEMLERAVGEVQDSYEEGEENLLLPGRKGGHRRGLRARSGATATATALATSPSTPQPGASRLPQVESRSAIEARQRSAIQPSTHVALPASASSSIYTSCIVGTPSSIYASCKVDTPSPRRTASTAGASPSTSESPARSEPLSTPSTLWKTASFPPRAPTSGQAPLSRKSPASSSGDSQERREPPARGKACAVRAAKMAGKTKTK